MSQWHIVARLWGAAGWLPFSQEVEQTSGLWRKGMDFVVTLLC